MNCIHQLSFRNINLKVDHHLKDKLFIHGPKTPQGEPVAKHGTLLLNILSLVW